MIRVGVDSFATLMAPPSSGASVTPAERLRNLLGEIELAEEVGLDAFVAGELKVGVHAVVIDGGAIPTVSRTQPVATMDQR